ncbi:MAG TPA: GFA family protein [Opitutus sp.]|nr:GFA family protein [Opitutus sp.]
MELTGGCLCGQTRYTLHSPPYGVGNCHCIDCQRASGAPFVTWGSVPVTDVQVSPATLRQVAHAGRIRTFAHCCGTPLFFAETTDASELDIAIATLDSPSGFPPKKNIWTEDKLPWVELDPALPSFRKSSRDDASA